MTRNEDVSSSSTSGICLVAMNDSILHVTNSVMSSSLSNECNVSLTFVKSHSQSCMISWRVVAQATTEIVVNSSETVNLFAFNYHSTLPKRVFGAGYDKVLVLYQILYPLCPQLKMTNFLYFHVPCDVVIKNKWNSLPFPYNFTLLHQLMLNVT